MLLTGFCAQNRSQGQGKLHLIMGTSRYVLLSLAFAALTPGIALADLSFTWSVTAAGNAFSGVGDLTAVADTSAGAPAGMYDITGLIGTINGSAVTLYGLGGISNGVSNCGGNPGPDCYNTYRGVPESGGANFTFNNAFYGATGGVLDSQGIILSAADGTVYNIWGSAFNSTGGGSIQPAYVENLGSCADCWNYNGLSEQFTVNPELPTNEHGATPEPSFYGVLAVGMAGLAVLRFRRARAGH